MEALEILGITREELLEKVVDKLVLNAAKRIEYYDCEDDEVTIDYERLAGKVGQEFENRAHGKLIEAIDNAVTKLVEEQLKPKIFSYKIQEYDRCGEPVGEPRSVIERLLEQSDNYFDTLVHKESGREYDNNYHCSKSDYVPRFQYFVKTQMAKDINAASEEFVRQRKREIAETISRSVRDAVKQTLEYTTVETPKIK